MHMQQDEASGLDAMSVPYLMVRSHDLVKDARILIATVEIFLLRSLLILRNIPQRFSFLGEFGMHMQERIRVMQNDAELSEP